MNEITILLIIFSLLFLIEFKSINNLANYIGIVLSIAILISLYFPYFSYISFILILIQISALTILFGLIIMLFPYNHTLPLTTTSLNPYSPLINKSYIWQFLLALLFLFLFILFNLPTHSLLFNLPSISSSSSFLLFDLSTPDLLFKIAQAFYTDPHFISKFLLLTFLLFFAIVALFFLVLPTNSITRSHSSISPHSNNL